MVQACRRKLRPLVRPPNPYRSILPPPPPQGRPILATSTLSPHTGDLIADGRCSLTVTAPGFTVRARRGLARPDCQGPGAEGQGARGSGRPRPRDPSPRPSPRPPPPPPPQSLQDARFTLAGTAVLLPDSERAAVRDTFLAKYPQVARARGSWGGEWEGVGCAAARGVQHAGASGCGAGRGPSAPPPLAAGALSP
jgi:hypothetical protein